MNKFRLPRPISDPSLKKIILRELRRGKTEIGRASKKIMIALRAAGKAIEEKGIPDGLVRKRLPKNLGYGIFLHPLAPPIPKGEVITSYAGILSLESDEQPSPSAYAFALLSDVFLTRREKKMFGFSETDDFESLYSLILDAEKEGNFSRFINHSSRPNIVSYLFSVPRNNIGLPSSPLEVIYFAKKKILPGEQLLISYEGEKDSYWKELSIKPLPINPQTFMLVPSGKVIASKKK